MIRALIRAYCLWQANGIAAERRAYQSAGLIGLQYMQNSIAEEGSYRSRAAQLLTTRQEPQNVKERTL